MKIYLAAPYAARDLLKEDLAVWEQAGHEVTCGWVKGTRPLGAASYGISAVSTDEEVEAHAEMDLDDVDRADVLVHYTSHYILDRDRTMDPDAHNLSSGGRHVETGYAIAKGKRVIVMGPLENIFQRGLCIHADGIPDALAIIDNLPKRKRKDT